MALKSGAVIVDAIEHDGGNRKDDSGRREFPFRKDMMDEAAVHSSIAVLERVDIDKSEGSRGRVDYGIHTVLTHPIVGFEQPVDEVGEILWPGADELRDRIATVVTLAEVDAVGT